MNEQKKETAEVTAISNNCTKCGHPPKKTTYKFCTRCGSVLKEN